jgi:hypothetical protein
MPAPEVARFVVNFFELRLQFVPPLDWPFCPKKLGQNRSKGLITLFENNNPAA